jgi:hypothetical protein
MIRTTAVLAAVTCVALLPASVAAQTKPAADATSVTVTVKYAGKGTVDANHRIWVWLFDTPDIGPGSIPIGEMSLEKNGETAAFPNVTAKEVYIAAAYDEAGGFLGQAPPPAKSPIVIYGVKAATDKPMAVVPGAKGKVRITFDDAQRMQ